MCMDIKVMVVVLSLNTICKETTNHCLDSYMLHWPINYYLCIHKVVVSSLQESKLPILFLSVILFVLYVISSLQL